MLQLFAQSSAPGGEVFVLPVMCGFFVFALIINILLVVFWIWMIVDCATNEPSEGNDKIIWILVIVLTGGIGGAIYYFARRPKRIAQFGR